MRNNIIDIAKGIGIILVVAGHSMEWPKNFIYLFHMPLFFFFYQDIVIIENIVITFIV